MATKLGEDLRTHIAGFVTPGRELARLSCISKGSSLKTQLESFAKLELVIVFY